MLGEGIGDKGEGSGGKGKVGVMGEGSRGKGEGSGKCLPLSIPSTMRSHLRGSSEEWGG